MSKSGSHLGWGIEFSVEIYLVLIAVAFAAGFISSIAGAGGLIVLPFLLWVGVAPINALATNKFQSVFGTLSSTLNFFRKGHIDFRELAPAMGCAFVGACMGTMTVQLLNPDLLELLLPYLLIVLAVYFAFSPRISDVDSTPRLSAGRFNGLIGGGIGFYGGFLGPGMGSFYAAAFASLRGNNMRKATAHTKPLVLVTNTTSMVIFLLGGHIVWSLALGMAAAQFVGARLGSNLVIHKGAALVRPVIIFTTVAIAIRLLVK